MTTATGPTTAPSADQLRAEFTESLGQGLREGLDSPTPGTLLGMASSMLDISSHPDADPGSTAQVVRHLTTWDRPETSAGALAIATLADEPGLRRWARRDIADRGHTVPRWLADLHLATPAARTVELIGPFREADDLVLGVTTPSGHALTTLVRVDNELGARAVDGALFEHPIETVLRSLRTDADPDLRIRDISAADARARLTAAFTGVRLDEVLRTSTKWRNQRCIVRWMLSRFPDGGDATVPGRLDDVDTDELTARFLASPWGRPWTRGALPLLVERVFASGLSNGVGDPLLWAPRHVGRLLDPRLHDLDPDELDLDRAPELLRDLIRYGHDERGVRVGLTDASLHAVDRWAPAFRTAVRTWDDELTA
ncbi:hypothetical protein [Modestobacter sp. VKM Ac-2985]|uniref:hypothetical protein n=1 Tax=Modestobacter sp. VKM Ac-2985 TaxID=3004139 RepID=UPI0022AB6DF3|nr:hypothetical protein [Modestobacter sp. VKM Ac-2985]MCZ2839947.1 hypothetical protein [Modestobacter sp. VKM Ac-2985]